jgi:elongation factor Ts
MKKSTALIKQLRDETGAGVLEAKKALDASDGDFEKAADALKQAGIVRAAKKADREASEGLIEVYSHPGNRVGVMVEVNCETDFVARNESFQTLAHDLVLHVAAMQPKYLSQEDVPQEEFSSLVEGFRAQARAEGKPEAVIERIVEGRVNKFYQETCLLEQPFVKDEEVVIKDLITDAIRTLGENIVVRRFVRYELGETL